MWARDASPLRCPPQSRSFSETAAVMRSSVHLQPSNHYTNLQTLEQNAAFLGVAFSRHLSRLQVNDL